MELHPKPCLNETLFKWKTLFKWNWIQRYSVRYQHGWPFHIHMVRCIRILLNPLSIVDSYRSVLLPFVNNVKGPLSDSFYTGSDRDKIISFISFLHLYTGVKIQFGNILF